MYLFVPRSERQAEQYERFIKITDIFPVNSVGIVTSRDALVIDDDKEALKRRIRQFRDKNLTDEFIREAFGLGDTSNCNRKDAREKIYKNQDWEDAITQILYRPFDVRWIFYHDEVIERSRKEVMRHLMHENLGLITVRQVAEGVFDHAYVANTVVESRITLSNKGIAYIFPLYIFKEKEASQKGRSSGTLMMLFEPQAEYQAKRANLSPKLMAQLKASYKKVPTPEEIYYYIYAVLYSNTYRTKYSEFLKTDFPRVPFTKDFELFRKMGKVGERLVSLHLMTSPELDRPVARFEGGGDNKVEKPKYDSKTERVYINTSRYFEGVSPAAWEYRIGGYQVCDKWLKDRKGRTLNLEHIKHYCRVVTALHKTIEAQKGIDEVYEDVEKKTAIVTRDDCQF